ncbi:hypothetical protein FRD01_17665 [Microvenator marinus]|jgi:uncharacterized membrane protein|uniref:Copper resistance protein D domain-containing protein n=2 Tax=Microvenator marinus TaxID=2600177 RepID=A0A5B8XYB9_9DELT|nr:hypothetical protein FRD01_17665 [Microvenator marinus]
MLDLINAIMNPLRWIHIMSGALWFGLVFFINVVILPALKKNPKDPVILDELFPRIFRLASIVSATVVVSGTLMLHGMVDGDWTRLLSSGRWGHALLLGGGLAWGITIFHFVVESILAKRMGFDSSADPQAMAKFHVVIQKVPRVAMVVLSAIFLLMMIAARGI